jgi:hypothetical protein
MCATANELFSFRVCDVEPKSARCDVGVSLSDVDVEVDVIEPATLPPPIVALQIDAAATVDCVASQATPAYFSLQLGDADVGQRFRVSVQCEHSRRDPDMFASQLMKRPSAVAYEWQAQLDGADEELLFVCGDGASQVHPNAPLYVAVTTYGSDVPCTFSIALQRVVAENRLNGDGQRGARRRRVRVVRSQGAACVTCAARARLPARQLRLQDVQRDDAASQPCQARDGASPAGAVLARLRSNALAGRAGDSSARDVSPARRIACLYCPMQVSLLERGAHQNLCAIALRHANGASLLQA